MLSVRYTQQTEINLIVSPSTTNDVEVAGSSLYNIVIDQLNVTGYNSANPFTGGQLRLMVYIGYVTPFLDRIPANIGGNILYFLDSGARGFYKLDTAIYIPVNRVLRLYVNNQSTSLTQHVQALCTYRIV